MRNNRNAYVLRYIVDYCNEINSTIERFGNDYGTFSKDSVYQNAVLQIGELTTNFTEDFKNTYNEMPWNQIINTIVLTLLIIFSFNVLCYGNASEPPSILFIVPNAPDDMSVTLKLKDREYEAKVVDKVIEKYYIFYSSNMMQNKPDIYDFIVNTENDSFEIELAKPYRIYNNTYTLNLQDQTLTEGILLSRSIMLVTIRVVFTLIIEGLLFWIFGFRDKRSWIVFIIINLITQGALNIWLNGNGPIMNYAIFVLIFGEIFVFTAEIIAFLFLCKEHGRSRKVIYVLTANLASLILGGYLITVLPV